MENHPSSTTQGNHRAFKYVPDWPKIERAVNESGALVGDLDHLIADCLGAHAAPDGDDDAPAAPATSQLPDSQTAVTCAGDLGLRRSRSR